MRYGQERFSQGWYWPCRVRRPPPDSFTPSSTYLSPMPSSNTTGSGSSGTTNPMSFVTIGGSSAATTPSSTTIRAGSSITISATGDSAPTGSTTGAGPSSSGGKSPQRIASRRVGPSGPPALFLSHAPPVDTISRGFRPARRSLTPGDAAGYSLDP